MRGKCVCIDDADKFIFINDGVRDIFAGSGGIIL
jgi:hypothetical protein